MLSTKAKSLCVSAAVVLCAIAHTAVAQAIVADKSGLTFDQLVLQRINAIRKEQGAPALVYSGDLASTVAVHSDWMAATSTLSHEMAKPGWAYLGDRLSGLSVRPTDAHENIYHIKACDIPVSQMAQTITDYLFDDTASRSNALDPEMTNHAIAAVRSRKNGTCDGFFISQLLAAMTP